MQLPGTDLETYGWWGCVIFAREARAKFLRPHPVLFRPRPLCIIYRALVMQMHIHATSHESPQVYISAIGSAGDKLAL